MPRTAIPITTNPALGGGVDSVAASATAGDQANNHEFINNGKTRILMINGSGGPLTATVISKSCSHGRTLDVTMTAAAGDSSIYGPFPQGEFNQTGGLVNIDLADDTSISFLALDG